MLVTSSGLNDDSFIQHINSFQKKSLQQQKQVESSANDSELLSSESTEQKSVSALSEKITTGWVEIRSIESIIII